MRFDLSRGERNAAVRASLLLMILFIVLLLEVDIEHLVALWAFFDVSATIAEMRGHFAFRKLFEAILTLLEGFVVHIFQFN